MKHVQKARPWTAFIFLFSIFATSYSHASGSKMPVITDGETVIADTPSNTIPSPDGGGSTTPLPLPAPGGELSTALTFNKAWAKSGTSIVIDAYEGNSIDWNKMASTWQEKRLRSRVVIYGALTTLGIEVIQLLKLIFFFH